MRKASDPALPSVFPGAIAVVQREGVWLVGVSGSWGCTWDCSLGSSFGILFGRRKCAYLEMFMMVSGNLIWAWLCSQFYLVKPEELILKMQMCRGRALCY